MAREIASGNIRSPAVQDRHFQAHSQLQGCPLFQNNQQLCPELRTNWSKAKCQHFSHVHQKIDEYRNSLSN